MFLDRTYKNKESYLSNIGYIVRSGHDMSFLNNLQKMFEYTLK